MQFTRLCITRNRPRTNSGNFTTVSGSFITGEMAENPIVALLGNDVQDKSKEKVPVASLQKKEGVIGLYFSGHWCPPCRQFTPKLAEFYVKFNKSANGDKFEIVFVSSDQDEESFDDYYGEMPWLAVPFKCKKTKTELAKKFKVTGIPKLVFVDSYTGKLITENGRDVVSNDPDAKQFPWK